jgi:hypothetical protein
MADRAAAGRAANKEATCLNGMHIGGVDTDQQGASPGVLAWLGVRARVSASLMLPDPGACSPSGSHWEVGAAIKAAAAAAKPAVSALDARLLGCPARRRRRLTTACCPSASSSSSSSLSGARWGALTGALWG